MPAPLVEGSGAAEVGRVAQAHDRVDHQRLAVVVVPDLEPHLAAGSDHEPAGHRVLDAIDDLIGDRGVFDHVSARGVQDEVALGIKRFPRDAVKRQPDGAGARAGLDHEVVLELLLVAVVDQVDAAVDTLVGHLGVVGDVGVPLRRVVADEVVTHAGLLVETDGVGAGVRPDELHGHDVAAIALLQLHHGAGGCQERRVAGTLGQEVDPRIGLALVDLEAQRELAVGCTQMSLRGGIGHGSRGADRQGRKAEAVFEGFEVKAPAGGNAFSEHCMFSL